jgi:hypothetical protein
MGARHELLNAMRSEPLRHDAGEGHAVTGNQVRFQAFLITDKQKGSAPLFESRADCQGWIDMAPGPTAG